MGSTNLSFSRLSYPLFEGLGESRFIRRKFLIPKSLVFNPLFLYNLTYNRRVGKDEFYVLCDYFPELSFPNVAISDF